MAKKKKYSTRYERNKKVYYDNRSVTETSNNSDNKKIVLLILIISILCNAIFLVKINSMSEHNKEIKQDYKDEVNEIKDSYSNYLFLGDSITDFYDLDKYYKDFPVVNSGISGNTTDDILDDMKNRVYDYNPSKVFLLIGTNDLIHNKSVDEIVDNIKKIIDEINESRPQTKIYLESIYPVNKDIDEDMVNVRDNKDIKKINKELEKYCKDSNCTYLNIYDELINKDGNFDEKYTDDGLHPNDKGYEVVTKELKKYLED